MLSVDVQAPSVLSPLVRARRRPLLLVVLLVLTLAIGALALPALGTMSDRGTGVIEFELARTSERAEEIVREWGDEGRDAARDALVLDYPYLIAYGLLLAAACATVSDRASRRGRPGLARVAGAFAWGGLGAAACDALENACLLAVAAEHTGQPWPGLAFAFAVVKFALSAGATLFALIGWALTRPPR